jgi:hypothetical protein
VLPSRIITKAGLGLAAAVLATAAPASAAPAPDLDFTQHPLRGLVVGERSVRPARVADTAAGFDWGDAAIGAGATLGLVLVTAGGGAALTRRRTRHPTVRSVA